jgi:hypothetical protein
VRQEERRRLEAKGWRVGSAQDFLRLTDEKAAYIDLELRLATSLRDRRQRRGLPHAGGSRQAAAVDGFVSPAARL